MDRPTSPSAHRAAAPGFATASATHVPPLFEIRVTVLGWDHGDAEIDATFGAGVRDRLAAASEDDAEKILDRLRGRLLEEIDEAFRIFGHCPRL